jgi:hypothetical protein
MSTIFFERGSKTQLARQKQVVQFAPATKWIVKMAMMTFRV